MNFHHGGLAFDLPDSWRDQSTLVFTAPLEDGQLASEVVSISFHPREGGVDPKTLLDAQAEQLRAMDPGFELLDDGPFDCALGDGWGFTQRVTLNDKPVQQLVVACDAGSILVLASAATSPDRYREKINELVSILGSMRPGGLS